MSVCPSYFQYRLVELLVHLDKRHQGLIQIYYAHPLIGVRLRFVYLLTTNKKTDSLEVGLRIVLFTL